MLKYWIFFLIGAFSAAFAIYIFCSRTKLLSVQQKKDEKEKEEKEKKEKEKQKEEQGKR